MVNVVLKWSNSTAYSSHNYESFVFKFGEGDIVSRINNPAKFSHDRISGGAPTWWWNIGVACLLLLFFFFSFFSFLAMHTAHTRESISTHNTSKNAVQRKEVSVLRNFDFLGAIIPENPTNLAGSIWKSKPKWKGRITIDYVIATAPCPNRYILHSKVKATVLSQNLKVKALLLLLLLVS